jgi:uncharacterized membrane protein
MSPQLQIAGIAMPFDSRLLLTVIGVHLVAGVCAVIAGAVAMLSPKQAGRHPAFGRTYCWSLLVVTATMTILSIARWREDFHLFILGALAACTAIIGLTRVRRRSRQLRAHVISFGASYILLLTAFYVDNGKNLPLWNSLPPISYWVIPSMLGVPLIIYALLRHPLLRIRTRLGRGDLAATDHDA